jgi:hypothetical protein
MIQKRWSLLGISLILVAACTNAAPTEPPASTIPTTTTTSTTLPADAAATGYVACLNDNGVVVDQIPLDADGRPRLDLINSQLDYSDPATVEAISQCAEFLASGALDLAGDEDLREGVMAQLTAFSRCVRARGVADFPDPLVGFIGIGSPYPAAEIPYADPELPAAAAACSETVFGEYPGAGG